MRQNPQELPGDSPLFDDVRYLLLRADITFGQGDVALQPWLDEQSALMVADLSQDWSSDIEQIHQEGLVAYLEDLRGSADAVEHRGVVIPFRSRDSSNDDKE